MPNRNFVDIKQPWQPVFFEMSAFLETNGDEKISRSLELGEIF